MTIWAKLAIVLVAFLFGMAAGVKVHAGLVAQAELQQQQQAARERIRQQEFAAPKALEHAQAVEDLSTQLIAANDEITRLAARPCLNPRTVGVLNATGVVPRRAPASQPATSPASAAPAGGDAAGTGLRWASNIDVGQYIAYCRTQYGKVKDQLDDILDIEDQRHPLAPGRGLAPAGPAAQ